MSACTQKAPNPQSCFLRGRLTKTPRRRHPADGQLFSLYPTSPSFSSFGAACVMCCLTPASSSTPLRPSVYNARISLIVNKMCIRNFCDHLNIPYIFDHGLVSFRSQGGTLRREWRASSLVLLPSLPSQPPPTPSPSRWPDLTTLSPLAKFQLVWCRLCEALLSSSLARQTRPSLLSCLCLTRVGRYKIRFALNMTKSVTIFAN